MDPIPNCPKLKWFQVDVFTSRPFGGNPLAVFPEAPGLEGRLMQDIAREMNLSETVFASPARESEWDYEVRIFTPTRELPFAGHPVIGTAHVLLHTRPEGSRPDRLRLKMKAGVVPVEVEHAGQVIFMDQPLPDFGKTVSDM
ncbi:MAG: PhzF family phenazine biosynthesis isomerase, partial [Nitrospinaceae bacterium]|nr:PhzF family phenazine biosynthesis protein [Nitrospinaceae bacterium]NIR56295.1 PhzF family phenazine biosynthesis protein [Nitrospinaceae bacterium]NIS86752.1 PhzF family phenazine biosynthesis protein [Nitrospinaceae bacterium]NIT83587.1 PhzF family phenazine biosynthesis protein [Nitrospinaceae bacterium]NIU45789.1 PhzF family phenazine biosynthesis protein [Nitrospinaceae bacterium]